MRHEWEGKWSLSLESLKQDNMYYHTYLTEKAEKQEVKPKLFGDNMLNLGNLIESKTFTDQFKMLQ